METIEKLREAIEALNKNILEGDFVSLTRVQAVLDTLPTLLDELERLQKENGAMRDALEQGADWFDGYALLHRANGKSAHDERSVIRNCTFGFGVEVVADENGRAVIRVRRDLDLEPGHGLATAHAEEIVAAWSEQLRALRSAAE